MKNKLYSTLMVFLSFLFGISLSAQTTVTLNYTGTIDSWTVPAGVATVTIEARGAEGGNGASSNIAPGLGAIMIGDIAVVPGQKLKILVGQQAPLNSNPAAGNGGGGGSFVVDSATSAPLIVAGGGGGSSTITDSPQKHGQITTTGGTGAAGGGTGGTAGNGGNVGASGFQSGAGGGLLTDGADGWAANTGGISFLNGGAGANVGIAIGGFGGGGSGSGWVVGGGGGGYSGGGSGGNSVGGVGGGGGSYNGGANQSNTAGANSGHGLVKITYTVGSPNPSPCAATATFKLYGLNSLWANAGANDPDMFYHGIDQWKRMRANVSGGVGPYTYSWSNSEGYQMKNPSGNQVYIFEPLGPSWAVCEITDVGAACTFVDSIFVDWTDVYYCGDASNFWKLKMCVGGLNVCLPWEDAKDTLVAMNGTLGDCPVPKSASSTELTGIRLYPNPANSVINVASVFDYASSASLEIVDLSGKILQATTINIEEGVFEYGLQTSNLTNGMYMIRISTNREVIVERFQIVK